MYDNSGWSGEWPFTSLGATWNCIPRDSDTWMQSPDDCEMRMRSANNTPDVVCEVTVEYLRLLLIWVSSSILSDGAEILRWCINVITSPRIKHIFDSPIHPVHTCAAWPYRNCIATTNPRTRKQGFPTSIRAKTKQRTRNFKTLKRLACYSHPPISRVPVSCGIFKSRR